MVEEACLLNVLKSDAVHRFFVLDPEGSVPGFVVCPSVHVCLLCLVDVLIIEGQRAVSSAGWTVPQPNTSDQQGQGVIRYSVDAVVFIDPNPADRFAAWGNAPNHHVPVVECLLPDRGDLVSVGDVDRPVASVGIEFAPCCGLDGEGWFGHEVVC